MQRDIYAKIIAKVKGLADAIGNIGQGVGDLSQLTTTDKTDLVSAVNEVNGKTGTLASLTTSDKDNLVEAINEVDGDVDDVDEKIGVLASLDTTAKENVVNAINEVNTKANSKVTKTSNSSSWVGTLEVELALQHTYLFTSFRYGDMQLVTVFSDGSVSSKVMYGTNWTLTGSDATLSGTATNSADYQIIQLD